MDCPNCGFEVRRQNVQGVDIGRCSECAGIWLHTSEPETGKLRDAMPNAWRTPVSLHIGKSDLMCPECREQMQRFESGSYNLKVEVCLQHGFWIDRAEEKRVMRVIEKEAKAINNRWGLKNHWAEQLIGLKSAVFSLHSN